MHNVLVHMCMYLTLCTPVHVHVHCLHTVFVLQLHSDWVWGMCVDDIVKHHMAYDPPVYMYEFAHRSEYEYLPYWMGTSLLSDILLCCRVLKG